ncbi:hypothetical protein D3OALGA1CA_5775 [Olavius algarvensis associated proteobacterium Delta 3]|nr:hypothetical protein D3OALGB2SA_2399 [Olavius algarvensis associated proteobacterium Delta 3]CAB5171521.1 hypothetical protein D3OALGA1CA_5775 [Olavius algarvensis associated proteobacterium Delta 3]
MWETFIGQHDVLVFEGGCNDLQGDRGSFYSTLSNVVSEHDRLDLQ